MTIKTDTIVNVEVTTLQTFVVQVDKSLPESQWKAEAVAKAEKQAVRENPGTIDVRGEIEGD